MSELPSPFGSDLKVLVLAGTDRVPRKRRVPEGGGREVPLRDKAFLPLRGRLVIEYVLDWLAAAGLEKIWVLAAPERLEQIPSRHRFEAIRQPGLSSIFVNLSLAHARIAPEPDEPVLVVFGDHPLNTPAALHDFLRQCATGLDRLDFAHAFPLREAYAEYAPHFVRTSVHLREMCGRASGINLAVPSRLHRLRVLDEMYGVRKLERLGSFFGLLLNTIRWLGPRSPHALVDAVTVYLAKECEKRARRGSNLAAALESRLQRAVPADRVLGYAARVLGAEREVRLVPIEHGGIAIDVDFAEELEIIEARWEQLVAVADAQDGAIAERLERSATEQRSARAFSG
jgi:molybdopterin-guanine dinucleotide biosynthesis protein A